MPQAAAAAVTGYASFAAAAAASAGAAFAYAAVYIVTAAAINYGLARLSQSLAGKPRNQSVGPDSRDVTVKGTVEPMQVIYGEVKTGGFIAYYGTSGENNKYLHFVIVVAAHQCEDITDCWLDSRRVEDAAINATTGEVVSSSDWEDEGTSRLTIRRYLGTRNQTADPELVSAFPGVWSSNHRGAGLAYVHFRLEFSEKVWPAGAPGSYFSLVKGRRVYDPSLDSTNGGSGSQRANDATTWTWSQNWALCVRDYLSGGSRWYDVATPEKRLCFGEDDDRIDDAYTIVARNISAESVTIPALIGTTTQERYTCDVQLSCGDTHRENLEILKSAGAGNVTYVNGKYRIHAGAYDVPTIELDQDDVLGPMTISTHPNGEDLYNFVTGTFFDELREWQQSTFPSITNASYEAADGGQYPRKIELHATRSSYRAQRIAILHLAQSRNKITVHFGRLSPKAMGIAEHETFMLTIPEYGWEQKVFRCLEWEWMPDGFVSMRAREESSSAYEDPDVTTYAEPEEATVATPSYDEPVTPTDFEAVSMPEGILFRWEAGTPKNSTTLYRLYEHTAQTPFSAATEVWSGKSLHTMLERSGHTVQYYWLIAELNGMQSAATPVGNGLPASPSIQGFEESFHDSFEHQDYPRFYNLRAGTPTASYPTNGENGGRVLRFQNYGWIAWKKNIPYDPSALYMMTVRARMVQAPTNGQDQFLAGVEGVAADGTTLINTAGADTAASQHYFAASSFDFGGVTVGDWVTFRGYLSGHSATPSPSPAPSITDPMEAYGSGGTVVRFIRPLVIMNYDGGDGIMEVDYIKLERAVYTDIIAPESATSIADKFTLGPLSFSHVDDSVDVDTYSFTSDADGDLVVTVGFDARRAGGIGTNVQAIAAVRQNGVLVTANATNPIIETNANLLPYISRGIFPISSGNAIEVALRCKHVGANTSHFANINIQNEFVKR